MKGNFTMDKSKDPKFITLGDVIDSQNPGIRSNPYKYKIVSVLDFYKGDKEEHIYLNIEDIPEEYRNGVIHNIEPDRDNKTGCLYLKIVIL